MRNKRLPKHIFHVFCEGKTEVSYFVALGNKLHISVKGHHNNSKAVAEKILKSAIKKRAQILKDLPFDQKYTHFWMVFDEDANPNTLATMKTAQEAGIKVAYSNPCFELWLLLHIIKHPPHNNSCDDLGKLLKEYSKRYDEKARKAIDFEEFYPLINTQL